jgi:type IV pilus assembly protein PilQ
MVSTLERLAEQRKIQEEAAANEPVDTQTYTLNFVKADEIKTTIEKLISDRGKITLESRTNTLIVTDTKSNLIKIGRIIESLDKITPQVLIESKIIETTLDDDDKLGIDWTIRVTAQGAKRPATIPFTPGGDQRWMKNVLPSASPTDTNFPTGRPYAFPHPAPEFKDGAMIGDFVFGTLDFTSFQAVLEILNSRSDTKIVSNPSITTINNKEAKILVGTIVPIPIYEYSKEAGTRVISGYIDQEVGIKLLVTPNINEQDYVTLDIKPSVDEITGWTGPDNERPIISTRTAETKVMIKDGQTLVIGGLI